MLATAVAKSELKPKPGIGAFLRGLRLRMGGTALLRRYQTVSCVIVAACLGLAASGMVAFLGAKDLPETLRTERDVCARPEPGSVIAEPAELRSRDGVLEIDLSVHDEKLPDGTIRYCYLTPDGKPSPTLRPRSPTCIFPPAPRHYLAESPRAPARGGHGRDHTMRLGAG